MTPSKWWMRVEAYNEEMQTGGLGCTLQMSIIKCFQTFVLHSESQTTFL